MGLEWGKSHYSGEGVVTWINISALCLNSFASVFVLSFYFFVSNFTLLTGTHLAVLSIAFLFWVLFFWEINKRFLTINESWMRLTRNKETLCVVMYGWFEVVSFSLFKKHVSSPAR